MATIQLNQPVPDFGLPSTDGKTFRLSDQKRRRYLFDVIIKKNMFAKIIFGIERSTFLIDEQGILRKEWRKVSVKGYVMEVLEAVKSLSS